MESGEEGEVVGVRGPRRRLIMACWRVLVRGCL